jgi:outer membrane lipoprotein-sorting protein
VPAQGLASPLRRALLAALVLAPAAAFAKTQPPRAVTLSPEDETDLGRIEAYLDALRAFTGGFEQTAEDGSVSGGKFWLSRPGKMRFEYAPPSHLMIVSDGDYVAVQDTDLGDVQFYPVDSTPAWFLLREGVKLSGDVTVTRFERGRESLRVTLVETKDASTGSITLVFSDKPLMLRQWIELDAQGRSTSVALVNPESGGTMEPSLFYLPQQKPIQ